MTTHHSTLTIERIYPSTPARAFNAWAEPAAKLDGYDDMRGREEGTRAGLENLARSLQ